MERDRLVKRIPLPSAELVEIVSDDGTVLKCIRYAAEGKRAVLFCHGFMSAANGYDLPLRGFNIAETVYSLGYEVWILNFRGSGHGTEKSGAGDWNHAGDHAGAMDLEAVIERMFHETGKPVFCVGHSYGGMSLYVYLQGALFSRSDKTVIRDMAVAKKRNRMVAGTITIGSPICFARETRGLAESMRASKPAQAALLLLEKALLRFSAKHKAITIGDFAFRTAMKNPLLASFAMNNPLIFVYLRPYNIGAKASRLFGTWSAGNVSTLHAVHMIKSFREGDFSSFNNDFPDRRINYAEGLGFITAPVFLVAGGKDFIRPEDLVNSVLRAIASNNKKILTIEKCGHVDLIFHTPYKEALAWLENAAESNP